MEICLSEAEQIFIIHGAKQGIRNDGRGNADYRPAIVECGLVSNTSGSARLRLGNTDVLVGVKAEIESPLADAPDQGRVQFFVDCSANATPEFEGRGGEDLAKAVTSALTFAFSNDTALPLRSLCIAPNFRCWILYVDIVLLEYGGTVYDACALAVKAALSNVAIPKVTVTYNENQEPDLEVTDDPHDVWRLDIANVPVLVSVCKLGTCNLVDLTLEEEACVKSLLVMGISESGLVTFMRQEGKGSLDPESIAEMTSLGLSAAADLHAGLSRTLSETKSAGPKKQTGFLT